MGPTPTWWVLSLLFSLSWLAAVGFYLGPIAGVVAFICSQGLVTAAFLATAIRLELEDGELRIGRAVLELAYVSAVAGLDPEATAERSGPKADVRAHLVLRPYARSSIELTLNDPADPVPYWLVSTRRPAALAQAVQTARAARLTR
ncbi:hypothetical protein MLP_22540 [Microlunatus phosphovorus NM-1]|uniref:DUF3093 domain-containing protein n=1 Tax=Microlunatus phosphovorus (strain ATCC 700054 / DSM 10555 / JCM 9379 / NBRC 101784 / NCIMB 13414 / VKM Ac-1990 / NM-1) TaxID=1032480 RepID=F5XEQ2_MICPN|nr:DUF3093 domain-containing protein [Microlunatus phosphovorus]BAK35268.1 hypothetical protein MLP_22540 [Microlunatus phosphovorus NM-1]